MSKILGVATVFLLLGCSGDRREYRPPKPAELPFEVEWQDLQPADLHAVTFVDDTTGWAVGSYGTILKTEDGGRSWKQQAALDQTDLYAIDFVDRDYGWIGGDQGTILATTDGGRTWRQQGYASHSFGFLDAIDFVDRQHGLAGGNSSLFETSDGGGTWTRVEGIVEVVWVGLGSPTRRFVVGQNPDGPRPGETGRVITPWGPKVVFESSAPSGEWQRIADERVTRLSPKPSHSDTVGWLHTNDGGHTWLVSPLPEGAELPLAAVTRPWDRKTLFLDRKGRVFESSDQDRTWEEHRELEGWSWESMAFLDQRSGWIVGERGVIYATEDGGQSWTPLRGQAKAQSWPTPFPESFFLGEGDPPIAFPTAERGWAAGSRAVAVNTTEGWLLETRDGGRTWRVENRVPGHALNAVFFSDEQHGWAVGSGGALLSTRDGGDTWSRHEDLPAEWLDLYSVHFVDRFAGWVGGDGAIFHTRDGGGRWHVQAADLEGYPSVRSLWFRGHETGWAVLDHDEALVTRNGGDRWTSVPQYVGGNFVRFPTDSRGAIGADGAIFVSRDGGLSWDVKIPAGLTSDRADFYVYGTFANSFTGWMVSDKGSVISTKDGGESWVLRDLSPGLGLRWTDYHPTYGGRIVGDTGLVAVSREADEAPTVERIEVQDTAFGVRLSWTARDEHPESVQCTAVEFRPEGGTWNTQNLIDEPLLGDEEGTFLLEWQPEAEPYYAPVGKELFYRVTLRDDRGTSYVHEIERGFVYRPFWSRLSLGAKSTILAGACILGYLSLALLLLALSPRALRRLHGVLPLDALPASGPVGATLRALASATLVPALVKHRRVRRTWIEDYERDKVSFGDLDPTLKAEYLKREDCLDAWVARRRDSARDSFDRIASVAQRRIYIPLPVRKGDPARGRSILEPCSSDFREFERDRQTVLVIVGRGGAGKSTLAARLGHWSLDGELSGFPMIPVFVEEEAADFRATLSRRLAETVGADDLDDDLVDALLAHRRVLIIVDALSERTPETMGRVREALGRGEVGAAVLTTRRLPEDWSLETVTIWTQRLAVENLIYFLTEYLRRREMEERFSGRKALQLGDRLLDLLERSSDQLIVTPLLVKLFVDQAVTAAESESSIDSLPSSVPEMMLDYLRRVNPQAAETPNRVPHDHLIRAARLLGRLSLADSFQPRDFFLDKAERALREHGFADGVRVVERLLDNGVLHSRVRGGTTFLRFELDPLAEYLAALYLIDKFRGEPDSWGAFMEELAALPGYPREQHGFLVALEDCMATYEEDFDLPRLTFPWAERVA